MVSADSEQIRIGILGGSFDPPHWGHFLCARSVAEELKLDKVLVVPTNIQPHKLEGAIAPAALRMKMVRAACKIDPLFEPCDLELRRGGVSYSVDTIFALSNAYPRETFSLFLLLGTDAAAELNRWREPEKILELVTIAIMQRSLTPELQIPDHWKNRMIRATTPNIDISSTEIRNRIATEVSVSWHLPAVVEKIIRKYSLYAK